MIAVTVSETVSEAVSIGCPWSMGFIQHHSKYRATIHQGCLINGLSKVSAANVHFPGHQD
jgi:hypothetical protein